MTPMHPNEWIALGGVIVAGVSVVAATVIGPWLAGRVARQQLLHAERVNVYSDTLRLMRARTQEIERASLGWPVDDDGPDQEQAAVTTSRLLLLANDEIGRQLAEFFRLYWSTSLLRLSVEASRANGGDDIASRLAIADILTAMRQTQDRAADALRAHLGVKGRLPQIVADGEASPS